MQARVVFGEVLLVEVFLIECIVRVGDVELFVNSYELCVYISPRNCIHTNVFFSLKLTSKC